MTNTNAIKHTCTNTSINGNDQRNVDKKDEEGINVMDDREIG